MGELTIILVHGKGIEVRAVFRAGSRGTPGLDRIQVPWFVRIMKIAPIADVKARLSAYLDECGREGPLVITRNGKAVAVLLVPSDNDDLERIMLGRSPRFQALLNRSRKSLKEGKGLTEKAFWEAAGKRSQDQKATAAVRGKRKS